MRMAMADVRHVVIGIEEALAPVIGDPLYIPLYEELRKQQDDLANAVPDGEPWTFTMPTSLVYLQNSSTPLPPLSDAE